MWKVGHSVEVSILPPMEVPPFGYGQIYKIIPRLTRPIKQYEATIWEFPTCPCLDFIKMMANFLGNCGKWAHCKHVYFILQCHVLWKNWRFHSFSNLELEWSSKVEKSCKGHIVWTICSSCILWWNLWGNMFRIVGKFWVRKLNLGSKFFYDFNPT